MFTFGKSTAMPGPAEALPGRSSPIAAPMTHFVNGRPLQGPYPAGLERALFGMGCFWGAERKSGGRRASMSPPSAMAAAYAQSDL